MAELCHFREWEGNSFMSNTKIACCCWNPTGARDNQPLHESCMVLCICSYALLVIAYIPFSWRNSSSSCSSRGSVIHWLCTRMQKRVHLEIHYAPLMSIILKMIEISALHTLIPTSCTYTPWLSASWWPFWTATVLHLRGSEQDKLQRRWVPKLYFNWSKLKSKS